VVPLFIQESDSVNASTVALRRQTLNPCGIKKLAHTEMTRPQNSCEQREGLEEQSPNIAISQDRWVQNGLGSAGHLNRVFFVWRLDKLYDWSIF